MSKPRWIKSKRNRRHTACAFGRLSRRLRAELLEGRMMLSAAPLAFVAPDLPVDMYTFIRRDEFGYIFTLRGDLAATGENAKLPTQGLVNEGGFVSTNGAGYTVSHTPAFYTDFADTFLIAKAATNVTTSYFDRSVTMLDLLEVPTPLSASDGFNVWSEFEWSSNTGYVPQVFDSPAAESGPSPLVQPISVDADGGASHEGGAISIQWPTTPTNPGAEPKQPEPSLAALLMDSQDSASTQKPANSNRMTSSAPAVSGEWARAAVFEIAGGEPLAENAPSHDQRLEPADSAPVHDAPESSSVSDSKSHTLRKASLDSAQLPVGSASMNEVEPTDVIARETLATLDDAALIDLTGVALLDEQAATINGGVVTPHSDDALAAAFDQLGGDDLALASTVSDRVRVNWLSGTPLLLMFALERFTARKSRNQRMNIVGEDRPRE